MSERKEGWASLDLTTEQQHLLARLLEEDGIEPAEQQSSIARDATVPGQRPLSFAQQRLWLMNQLEPETSVYNIPVALRLSGVLNHNALQQALSEIVRRHEVLRTSLHFQQGKPVQVTNTEAVWDVPLVDLSHLPDAAKEAQTLVDHVAQEPFDLRSAPLVRARLLRLAENEHLLVIVMHHIASDGWSVGILFQELSSLYGAFTQSKPSPLPDLPAQYVDYALWQRERLKGNVLASQLNYWKQQLTGAPGLMELPADYRRPAVPSLRGGRVSTILPEGLVEDLTTLSRREGITLFMVLLAAAKLLLYRYTGQPDIIVGIPFTGRNQAQIEKLIGFFINTLVLRTDLSGELSFRELLARVREVCIGAYDHPDLPFEKLVEELQPTRSLTHTPLFQVFFNMVSTSGSLPELHGLRVQLLEPPEIGSKFDLTFYIEAHERRLAITLAYSKDLFAEDRIREMLEQLTLLLTSIVESPEESIKNYSLVTARVRDVLPNPILSLQSEWKASIQSVFVRQAQLTPDRLAVKARNETWTYQQLDERSNQLANHLLAAGLARQDVVAIWAERGPPLVWAILGILKAGGAFMIMDQVYPVRRLVECLRAAQPRAWLQTSELSALPAELENFIGESALLGRLQLHERPTNKTCPGIDQQDSADALKHSAVTDPGIAVSAHDLAYVTFTSGSTGKPKGVMGTHDSLTHYSTWLKETFGVNESDRFSMLSGLAHDPLLRDIFTPLGLGAALCIPPQEFFDLPGRLASWMHEENITITNLTPAMGQFLTAGGTGDSRVQLADLRYAFFVGDALTRSDVSHFRKLAPSATCINLYGTTETQRSLAHYIVPGKEKVDEASLSRKEVIPVGHGIHGVQLLVLSERQQLAGIGEFGEIHFRAPHLAKGYLGDDALTRQHFFINPFTGATGDRLYRTGDMGRYLPDGSVEIVGRRDEQVKVRGYRIELGEVEGVLGRQEGVGECVVEAREEREGERRLVAYVVRRAGAEEVESWEWRRGLEEELPQYMIPAIVVLERLPLTGNGKVDRQALAALPLAWESDGGGEGPATPVEEMLAGIWMEVLGVGEVSRGADFFELGGHSLLLTQVMVRVREVLGVELPLRLMFERPKLSDLAAEVEEQRRSGGRKPATLIGARRGEQELPLSFAQQRLWLLDQLEPQNPAYNLPLALRLGGRLDEGALGRALEEIVRRHEVLRTRVELRAGQPVQVIAAEAFVELGRVDLSHLEPEEAEREAQQVANQVGRAPFDLGRDPLLRARLVRLGEEKHVLVIVMHHIASDGWSLGVFARELSLLYEAYHDARETPLAALTIQYADYAQWQREWLSGEVLEEQLNYWRGQLGGAPAVLELPTDRARPAVQSFAGGVATLELSGDLKEQLSRLGRRRSCTLFMVLLAGFQLLLARYAGVADVVVGTPVAGRTRRDVEGLIGFFVNTLVLRTTVRGAESFGELLERVREISLGAYEHQELPFEKLVEELQPGRTLSHAPLFQVMFALQNMPHYPLHLNDLLVEPQRVEDESAKFELTVTIIDKGARGLHVKAVYRRDLFDEETVSRMLSHYEQLLKTISTGEHRKVWELSPLTAAERQRVVVGWNQTKREYEGSRCVHECFEDQANHAPGAMAVVFEEEKLTYQQLNERSNQLAHHLRSLGVGPEVLVGVLLERSVELVVGVLGVLKAGGAYVPLDAAYPTQRLRRMLTDARVGVVLTQQCLADSLALGDEIKVVCLDKDRVAISHGPTGNPPRGTDDQNLAYVIFTSGSTGRPKGVQIPHAAMVNLLRSMSEQPGLTSADVLLSVTPLTFDIAGLELFLPLMVGASAVLVSRQVAADGVELNEWLSRSRISVMQATPATWRLLIAAGWRGNGTLKILCGGEPLSQPLAKELLAGGASLWNLYGPTETTIWSAIHKVAGDDRVIPIGRPIANTDLYLIDKNFEPVPIGAVGEVYIGGAGLARGYLSPAQTAERFLPNPFSTNPGARLYRTGDMARYSIDGRIQFIGRRDEQVKVRGYRIELGEVEGVLGRQEGVGECVVEAREEREGERRLVAYVVRRAGAEEVESWEWRRGLEEELPQYMIPGAIVVLERLPLTGNGKVDRQALAALPLAWESDGGGEGPATPVEEMLAGIWMEVLGVGEVSRGADFFELGGHSLLLTQVMVRVREVLGVELPLRLMFERPKLSDLAAEVEEQRRSECESRRR